MILFRITLLCLSLTKSVLRKANRNSEDEGFGNLIFLIKIKGKKNHNQNTNFRRQYPCLYVIWLYRLT